MSVQGWGGSVSGGSVSGGLLPGGLLPGRSVSSIIELVFDHQGATETFSREFWRPAERATRGELRG